VTNGPNQNTRSVAEIINGFREELKDFAITRVQMLRSEMKDKIGAWKMGLTTIAIGLVFMLVSFLLLTCGFVSLVALAFQGQPWAYAVAFFIVTVVYALIGALFFVYGFRTIREGGLAPQRTLKVLKEDQVWLKTEARSQV
jgi:Na+/melibiose symporter-like transporter